MIRIESPSLGNYGQSESLTICPSDYVQTEIITVFAQFDNSASKQLLEFLEDELISWVRLHHLL